MNIFNTLARKIEQIAPPDSDVINMYSCGPTVYRYVHIGNLRTYLMADWIKRSLLHQGYGVRHVKNITDVGHMRQEMLEQSEDKVLTAALAEGKSPYELAEFYTQAFHDDEKLLNILPADHFPKATEHIQEMISIVSTLIESGHAYEAEGNVYFSADSFPNYGRLSGNTTGAYLEEGVRVQIDPLKRDTRDFTLWKSAEPGRLLKWDSPWGEGFPGWHIECSAMSTKYLGQTLDIHTGGVDNIFPHHEGEIAQSESAFGKTFAKTWVHGQHLLADGVKMAKSLANEYTLTDLKDRGFEPMAFRYLCLTTRYRNRMNFTFSGLRSAARGLERLKNRVREWQTLEHQEISLADERKWEASFWDRVNDDLDLPGALALTWAVARSSLPSGNKLRLIQEFDKMLGLGLGDVNSDWEVPNDVRITVNRRNSLRSSGDYINADEIRDGLISPGYVLEDTHTGTKIRPFSAIDNFRNQTKVISSSKEVLSLLDEDVDQADFSIGIVACNYLEDLKRCMNSVIAHSQDVAIEILVVDNGSTDGTSVWLEDKAKDDSRLRVITTDHVLGEAEARNILLKQSLGRYIVLLDTSVEAEGDFLSHIGIALLDQSIGVVGPWGLRTFDVQNFQEIDSGPSDAMQAYCFAIARESLREVGLMRESFRFYRNLDIEFSFQFLDQGYSILTLGLLPLTRHEHMVWTNMAQDVRDKLSADNFRRFHKKWGHRSDLVLEYSGTDHH
jgi:cysteinyl-tRNA synthetase